MTLHSHLTAYSHILTCHVVEVLISAQLQMNPYQLYQLFSTGVKAGKSTLAKLTRAMSSYIRVVSSRRYISRGVKVPVGVSVLCLITDSHPGDLEESGFSSIRRWVSDLHDVRGLSHSHSVGETTATKRSSRIPV